MRDHCHTWDWVAQRLRDRYHIVAPDLRGHGDSQWAIGFRIQPHRLRVRHRPAGAAVAARAGHDHCAFDGRHACVSVTPGCIRRLVQQNDRHRRRRTLVALLRTARRHPSDCAVGSTRHANRPAERRAATRSLEDAFQRMQETNPHLSPEQARHLTEHGSHQNEDGTYTWKFDNYTHAHSPYDITSEDTEALWREITCPILFVNAKQGYPHRIGQGDTLEHFRNAAVVDLDKRDIGRITINSMRSWVKPSAFWHTNPRTRDAGRVDAGRAKTAAMLNIWRARSASTSCDRACRGGSMTNGPPRSRPRTTSSRRVVPKRSRKIAAICGTAGAPSRPVPATSRMAGGR